MASIVPGYNYDIFISYRQKDNKGDHWVSEFVEALRTELESTFKEEISVYFDINPHDGLLETHDVDASLKEKLKCLIFIPIISRTYCDPKSFAWEHEFKAFVEMASKDQFGLKVKLPNGNVASRVIPVRIHELEKEDIKQCEQILGGVLRGVEFVYREAGIDKPLAPGDDENRNLNKTKYRIQVIKVAHAIREICMGFSKVSSGTAGYNQSADKNDADSIKPLKSLFLSRKLMITAGAIMFTAFAFMVFMQLRHSQSREITIAVLPFRNPGTDSLMRSADGLLQDIINNLTKIEGFSVRGSPSSYQYTDSKKPTSVISRELKVDYIVGGRIDFAGKSINVNVFLVTKDDKQIWSKEYPGDFSSSFSLQSKIAMQIASELKVELSHDEIQDIERKSNVNTEAMQYYQQGNRLYWMAGVSGQNEDALKSYKYSIRLDPSFALAYTGIAKCYLDQYFFFNNRSDSLLALADQAIKKASEINPDLADVHIAKGWYVYVQKDYDGSIKEYEAAIQKEPENSEAIYDLAAAYRRKSEWDKAESLFFRAADIDPARFETIFEIGETSFPLRNYEKAEEYYQKSINLRPDMIDPYLSYSRMILSWKADTRLASKILDDAIRANSSFASNPLLIEIAVQIETIKGNYQGALDLLSKCKSDVFNSQSYLRPKTLYYAKIYELMNNRNLALKYYDSLKAFVNQRIIKSEKVGNSEENARLYSVMGIALAGTGYKEEAIMFGKKAADLMSIDKDAIRGPFFVENLARIYLMTGEYRNAIELLNHLLYVPCELSVKNIETNPEWIPLRGISEFQKMLQENKKKD